MPDITTEKTSLSIEAIPLKKAALVIRAVNHKLRSTIMQLIHKNGRLTVTEIYMTLNLEQSVASQHLAILRAAGFVTTDRKGKCIYYEVNYTRLEEAQALLSKLNPPNQASTPLKQSGVGATTMLQPV